jgi:phage shock protein C
MNSNTDDRIHTSQSSADDEYGVQHRQPLRRPVRGRMVAGVAAAIAHYFNVDVTIVRIAFAVLTIVGFTSLPFVGGLPLYLGGVPLYLAGWLLIPEQGSEHSIAGGFLRTRQGRSS